MIATLIIIGLTILAMILSILFFPRIRLGRNFYVDSYWVITCLGLAVLLIFGLGDINLVLSSLVKDSAINPIKILVLFVCMTILSIFLDELGFFRHLANVTLKKAGANRFKLFLYLYIIVSVLTVFTSNDIIILSFTPFICYFAKNAKINPIPYLATEFVAANTWSMALVIGNPTNIYLASAFNIDFISYAKVMIVPTILSGITAFIVLYLMFRKKLKISITSDKDLSFKYNKISNKPLLIIGLIHLIACTLFLVVSSYVNIEMWLVSLISCISLFVCCLITSAFQGRKPKELLSSIKRAPWQIIPFILSMFSIIIILSSKGVTEKIALLLGDSQSILKYGFISFFASDLINNIPMSVLFCDVLSYAPIGAMQGGVFATIIGSNLGALFTPIGALAGIMWNSILLKQNVKFTYWDFIKTGITVALPTLTVSLLSLMLFI